MFPQDVSNIIDDYNEHGIFISLDKIYWFNGKRFELWWESAYWIILTYEHDLYCYDSYNKGVVLYRNKQFINVKLPSRWNHPLQLFNRFPFMSILHGIVYCMKQGQLAIMNKNNINVLSKHKCRGSQIITCEDDIYVFGFIENQKFNTISKEYQTIPTSPFENYDIYLFNKKIYNFFSSTKYAIYDLEIGSWQINPQLTRN